MPPRVSVGGIRGAMSDVPESITLPSGLRLALAGAGDGPLAVLLHGFPELAVSWDAQIAALSDRWRVVAPDMPGYGGSDAPSSVRRYRLPALAADIAALIRVLGAERAHVVGHDWGGAVAWEVAMRHPDVVRTLAVCNCPPAAMLARELLTNPRQAAMSWYMLAFQVPGVFERLYRRDPGAMMARTFKANAVDRTPFTREHLAPYVENARRTGMRGGLAYYRASFRRPPLRLHPVAAPTALIWGTGDPALGPWFADPSRYGFVQDFTLHRIDGAGHWVQQEAPERVSAILRDHWARHEGG